MKTFEKWVAGTTIISSLILFTPIVWAQQEIPYDITNCASSTITMISASEELTVFFIESKGITVSNHPSKAFDNSTYHCGGVTRVMKGKVSFLSYCKFLDPDGDMVVGESVGESPEGKWTFLQGTGKYKGITGGGKNWSVTRGKPITPGTSQGCLKAVGTYKIPQ